MNVLNLLTTSSEYITFAVEEVAVGALQALDWLIGWLFSNMGYVAIGVLVFTLCLKTIVLPLDIYSRVKTKKQSLLMEKMRPQMEKLQKQYANDKNMYQQKVLELQKASGYNPLGACLPMVVSLVVFIVVFQSFSTYSNYATLESYNEMVRAYNLSVAEYVLTDEEGQTVNKDGFLIATKVDELGENYEIAYKINYDNFTTAYVAENGTQPFEEGILESDKMEIVSSFIRKNARAAAAESYRAEEKYSSMLWIGSMWYPDSMLQRQVPSFADFSSAITRVASTAAGYEESYNEVTFDLGEEKDTYNGYFVLILLAIGLMFLQQFIMMRSQKASNELSSVDGSAQRTTKWMMILMPIMYGVFSFFYSAAFSLYMITNTVYSLVSTLIINKAVAVSFAKKEARGELQRKSSRSNKMRK